jgi:SAM-dependent methyltransferase
MKFLHHNPKYRLPFDDEEFDYAYNRKGPTSAYLDLKRIVKNGGQIIALHPGDRLSPELSQLFPNLFEPLPEGTPVLDKIKESLEKGLLLNQATIETVTSVSYLPEPLDVVKVCCFGQTPSVHEMVINSSISEIERIFYKHAAEKGLSIKGEAYIVRAII